MPVNHQNVNRKLTVAHVTFGIKNLGTTHGGPQSIIAQHIPRALGKMGINSYIVAPMENKLVGIVNKFPEISIPIELSRIESPEFYIGGVSINKKHALTVSGHGELPLYLINNKYYLEGQELFKHAQENFSLEKLAFLSLSTLELFKLLTPPDIIVCHDWQTALVPLYLRSIPAFIEDPVWNDTKIIFTMHDIASQGTFKRDAFKDLKLGLDFKIAPLPSEVEHHGNVNLLKTGLNYSDISYTRSKEYVGLISTPHYGHELHEEISRLADLGWLVGISENDGSYNEAQADLAIQNMARGEIGIYRNLLSIPFVGMSKANQSFPIKKWQLLTTKEALQNVNPIAAKIYENENPHTKKMINKIINLGINKDIFEDPFFPTDLKQNGQAHIFEKVTSKKEMMNLIETIDNVGLEWIENAIAKVREFKLSDGTSSHIKGTIRVINRTDPEMDKIHTMGSDFSKLVEIGKKRKEKLGVLVLAGGAGTRFNVPVKALYKIKHLGNKNFLDLIIEDTIKTQKKEGVKIPIFVLTSPHDNWNKMRDYATDKKNGLGYKLVEEKKHLWRYKGPDDIDLIMFEFDKNKMRPKFDEYGKIIMDQSGKKLDLSPAGHGIVFDAFIESGAYKIATKEYNIEDLFFSNIDNLGRDISSDYYSAILGKHAKDNSAFTVEMVRQRDGEPVGGNPAVVNGKKQIVEQFVCDQNTKDVIMARNSAMNPVNYTINLPAFQQLRDEGLFNIETWTKTPQWIEKKTPKDDHGNSIYPFHPYFQLMLLAGDYSVFQEPKFILVKRDWRFSPTKEKADVEDGSSQFKNKWNPANGYK